jgi:hypothetical protein
MYSKRGQVTLFVILAVAIIAIVLLAIFLLPKINKPKIESTESLNPGPYIESCFNGDEELGFYLKGISQQGGYLSPNPYFTIIENGQSIKLPYLSSQGIIQKPLIEQDIESQLETVMKPIALSCIESYASGLRSKGNQVSICNSGLLLEIKLESGKVTSNITCPIKITTKDNINMNFDSIYVYKDSQLYDIVSLARDILNAERKNNIQEFLDLISNYQLIHPDILIYREERTQTPYHDITYRIIYGENKFYFAIRK